MAETHINQCNPSFNTLLLFSKRFHGRRGLGSLCKQRRRCEYFSTPGRGRPAHCAGGLVCGENGLSQGQKAPTATHQLALTRCERNTPHLGERGLQIPFRQDGACSVTLILARRGELSRGCCGARSIFSDASLTLPFLAADLGGLFRDCGSADDTGAGAVLRAAPA